MKRKLIFLAVVIITIFFTLGFYTVEKEDASPIDLSNSLPQHGWFVFDKNKKIDPKKVFDNYKDVFGLSKNDQMVLFKETTTEISNEVFYKFQQYYKGIKVIGAIVTLKSIDNILESSHGKIIKNLNLDIIPKITEKEALEKALHKINAEKYAWDSEEWEKQKQIEENSPNATWYPKAELLIISIPGFKELDKAEFCLAYKFDIQTVSPSDNYTVHIDANNGNIIRCNPKTLSAVGTVQTVYNGTNSITTYYRGAFHWDFILEDRTRTNKVDTREFSIGDPYPYCQPNNFWDLTEIDDNDNYWYLGDDNNAPSAHWAVSKTYEFFASQLNRTTGIREVSGYDIRVQNHFLPIIGGTQATTAFKWGGGGDYIYVGYFLGQNGFEGGLDVLAHEFTHGVAVFSAGLDEVYDLPSGPLTESFCDIFGEAVENYTLGSCDYIGGTNLLSAFKRCFYNPNQYLPHTFTLLYNQNSCTPYSFTTQSNGTYPTNYSEFLPGYNDNTAHLNCAIQNRWFYLLAVGDPSLGVQGIGITKAYRIAYRTLMYHIGPYSDFFDSRIGTIEAATALYGQCSLEYQQVMNAWAAVGIGSPAPNPCVVPLSASISGPSYASCGTYGYYSSSVSGGNGNYSYQWLVDYGTASYSSYLDYYFPYDVTRTYNITLIVSDGAQTAYDYFQTDVYCNYYMQNPSEELELTIYPNPVTDILTLMISEENTSVDIEYTVDIYDKFGKKLYSKKTYQKEMHINVSSYFTGDYYLTVSKANKKSSAAFIKK